MNTEIAPGPSETTRNSVFKLTCLLTRYPGLTITSIFFVSLFPAMRLSNIPWGSSFSEMLVRYSAVATQSIAYALILSAIAFPGETFLPFKQRYQASPPRLIILVLLATLFFYLYPPFAASILLLIAILALEAYERALPPRKLAQPLLPGLYLFIGLITVFGYNAVIVTNRAADYSHVLARTDSYLLFGHSVSELAHRFSAAVPAAANVLMVSYFALFAQIGAALLLLTFKVGRDEAMKFVSTILLAYLLTMTFWVIFPDYSPYFTCATHLTSALPAQVLDAQHALMDQLRSRQSHLPVPLSTEYYVSFPCMHITQPLIALWFLRGWRRIVFVLIPIDILIVAAIVLLEWHYVTDLLGGIVVAVAAIAATQHFGRIRHRGHSEPSRASTASPAAPPLG